ncbi:putative tRNA (guanine(26)-N(2))-dimethyltransferase 2 [Zea mays]|uniref:tRNA (guanine(26)-N(2))-dimethyltransferase n=1 Tax=Zea mays TaxID=4577 RepID=A0A1D6GZ73_MAIZE|nr:putative tRNA (guanine(26)-N(2))-dimethyltransferase 2 [Zea mays]
MTLSLGLLRSGLLNRRINQPANQVLRLHLAFSSASPSPSDPSAAAAGPQTTIREGKVEIFLDESNSVFYNKTQVNNRDISIAVLRSFILKRHEEYAARSRKDNTEILQNVIAGPGDTTLSAQAKYKEPKVLEALAASGLRAIRYAVEVDGIGEVTAVDNNEAAVEACKKNIQHNGSLASSKVVPHHADARVYMLTHPKEFDVVLPSFYFHVCFLCFQHHGYKVDLDPYGSPAAFLDSAVQCVADGGILMCSATDMAVLAGGNAEVCFSKYGSYPLRGKHCHEMALRILLACIEDKENIAVPNFRLTLPEVCSECGHQFVMGGPLWSYPIHDKVWAASILSDIHAMREAYPAYPKISAILSSVSEVMSFSSAVHNATDIDGKIGKIDHELLEAPLFVSLHNLCAILKCTTPTMVMLQCAIRNAGYQVSGSHVDPLALKTDAPMSVIWDIMRCWVKLHPVKHRPGNHPGNVILSQEPKFQAKFSRVLGASVTRKRARFMPNPEKYWGPGTKAGRNPRTFQMDNRN